MAEFAEGEQDCPERIGSRFDERAKPQTEAHIAVAEFPQEPLTK